LTDGECSVNSKSLHGWGFRAEWWLPFNRNPWPTRRLSSSLTRSVTDPASAIHPFAIGYRRPTPPCRDPRGQALWLDWQAPARLAVAGRMGRPARGAASPAIRTGYRFRWSRSFHELPGGWNVCTYTHLRDRARAHTAARPSAWALVMPMVRCMAVAPSQTTAYGSTPRRTDTWRS
jgi:hypothetical protein